MQKRQEIQILDAMKSFTGIQPYPLIHFHNDSDCFPEKPKIFTLCLITEKAWAGRKHSWGNMKGFQPNKCILYR